MRSLDSGLCNEKPLKAVIKGPLRPQCRELTSEAGVGKGGAQARSHVARAREVPRGVVSNRWIWNMF